MSSNGPKSGPGPQCSQAGGPRWWQAETTEQTRALGPAHGQNRPSWLVPVSAPGRAHAVVTTHQAPMVARLPVARCSEDDNRQTTAQSQPRSPRDSVQLTQSRGRALAVKRWANRWVLKDLN
jgi:hypothetical protein